MANPSDLNRYASGARAEADSVVLVASGDLRLSANQMCWPEQARVEKLLQDRLDQDGFRLVRAHQYDPLKQHGFIDSQRMGMEVFKDIDPHARLIVLCTAWQYSHHVLAGLTTHKGPILTLANWSGAWPGLVGLLNLNGSLTKAGVGYSTLWSERFEDAFFRQGLRHWLEKGYIERDEQHVRPLSGLRVPEEEAHLGGRLGAQLGREKAILGVFDEGCMGMYNAIVPDELLHRTGIFKERLSQSALYYEAAQASEEEAERCYQWLLDRGMTFCLGKDPETELTRDQVLWQLRTYVAAVRIADDFGCDAVGIQYQQGLKDLLPASDLAEGLLNNRERPPVYSRDGKRELYAGQALPHFNEVDECAGVDALATNRLWKALGFAPETTLHDLRWGEAYEGEFVWTLEISGAVPPAHLEGGYTGARSERQPAMYFRLGGGTIKGVSRPGEVVWSRVYVEEGRLKADLGRARALALPEEETERRWQATTSQWPIMHAVLLGISRDQMMSRHKSNHIQVAYAPDAAGAQRALAAKAAMFEAMGIEVFICGTETGLEEKRLTETPASSSVSR